MKAEEVCLLIGNSRWHWAFKNSNKLKFVHTEPNPKDLNFSYDSIGKWAAVGTMPKNIYLDPKLRLCIEDIPLINSPTWLGIDRALGAWKAFEKAKELGKESKGILVADAGTIFSITKVSSEGEFNGGQLIPGLRLQLEAMSIGAKNLNNPVIYKIPQDIFPVKTNEAMIRGALQAIICLLEEAHKTTKMPIWLCGGDSLILINELKRRRIKSFYYPNLVLEGMASLKDKKLNA